MRLDVGVVLVIWSPMQRRRNELTTYKILQAILAHVSSTVDASEAYLPGRGSRCHETQLCRFHRSAAKHHKPPLQASSLDPSDGKKPWFKS
jgi:hypothetical protein